MCLGDVSFQPTPPPPSSSTLQVCPKGLNPALAIAKMMKQMPSAYA